MCMHQHAQFLENVCPFVGKQYARTLPCSMHRYIIVAQLTYFLQKDRNMEPLPACMWPAEMLRLKALYETT
jgi:hypothetical protein